VTEVTCRKAKVNHTGDRPTVNAREQIFSTGPDERNQTATREFTTACSIRQWPQPSQNWETWAERAGRDVELGPLPSCLSAATQKMEWIQRDFRLTVAGNLSAGLPAFRFYPNRYILRMF